MILVSTSYAQTEAPPEEAAPAGPERQEGSAAEGGERDVFPPFDPATFGSQLFWLAILFGLLYAMMSRFAIPRIGSILEERDKRIAGDLAEATRAKEASDAAVAAHEQALAEARQNAHGIALKARDAAKAEAAADRNRIETELNGKLGTAEAEIAKVKASALGEVDSIARDAVEAIVETLVGTRVGKDAIAGAVQAAMAERG